MANPAPYLLTLLQRNVLLLQVPISIKKLVHTIVPLESRRLKAYTGEKQICCELPDMYLQIHMGFLFINRQVNGWIDECLRTSSVCWKI